MDTVASPCKPIGVPESLLIPLGPPMPRSSEDAVYWAYVAYFRGPRGDPYTSAAGWARDGDIYVSVIAPRRAL